MATINPVLTAADAANLVVTRSHEHMITSTEGLARTYPEFQQRSRPASRTRCPNSQRLARAVCGP